MKNKILVFFLSFLLIIGLFPLTAITDSAPTTLEAPTNLRAELKEDSDGMPYFELTLDVPKSVRI